MITEPEPGVPVEGEDATGSDGGSTESNATTNGQLGPVDATAIVLAGGLSTRMGEDKRLLPVGSDSLLSHVVGQLGPIFHEIILSVDKELPDPPPGIRQVGDRFGRIGPLGGVVSAMEMSEHQRNFVIACDIPFIPPEFVRELLRKARDFDVVVPVHPDGKLEPLFAVYRRSTLPVLKKLVHAKERRIRMLYDRVRTDRVPLPSEIRLANINTRVEYENILGIPRRKGAGLDPAHR